ncbi:hypothetical protein Nepgr_031941 [Nepenthes gracilis]|uniref:PDZ domain-containing protein n=1 Tax=Nepenthes gracilis TaxID=150966 RepID=A0AAD3TJK7_NEPGR|nr:hypothetical protein Nepgr_031941 [Nepenthes gracilis]
MDVLSKVEVKHLRWHYDQIVNCLVRMEKGLFVTGKQVLKVLSTSPVSGYLLPGDVIVSLDGIKIHNAHDWLELATLIETLTLQNSSHIEDVNGFMIDDGRKGYCAPSSVVEKSPKLPSVVK